MNRLYRFFWIHLIIGALLVANILPSAAYAQVGMSQLQIFSAIYPQLFVAPAKAVKDSPKQFFPDPTKQLLLQSYARETNYYQLSNNLQTNLKPTLKPLQDIQALLIQQGLTVSDYESLMQVLANNPQVLNRFVEMLHQNQGDTALLQLKQQWPNIANDLPTESQRIVFRNVIEILQGTSNTTVASKVIFQPLTSSPELSSTELRVRHAKSQEISGGLLRVAQNN